LVAGTSAEVTKDVSKDLQKYLNIKDLGNISHYLGIQIQCKTDGSFLLNQKGKIVKMLEEYDLLESKSVATSMETGFLNSGIEDNTKLPNNSKYRQAIGSLLYITTLSRPDIVTVVGILCQRVENQQNKTGKLLNE